VSRAISSSIAPLQLGIYTQRRRFERLLREAEPGAWAKAVALREIIIDPSPAYVHFAVGADALRATARRTGELLGGIDFLSFLEPWTRYAREQISHVTSITGMLGFNPLQVLARRLRANEDGTGDTILPPSDPEDGSGDGELPEPGPLPRQRPIATTAGLEREEHDDLTDQRASELRDSVSNDHEASHLTEPERDPTRVTELPEGRDLASPHEPIASDQRTGRH
jgi:hypothetical protein